MDAERKKRKEEGKRLKKMLIEKAGGKRPRKENREQTRIGKHNKRNNQAAASSPEKHATSGHRFGRVMENVPCRHLPRFSTVSIAVPGSVVANCQTKDLKTQICGQIARAATIYHVDEIIVFDDKLSRTYVNRGDSYRRRDRQIDDTEGHGDKAVQQRHPPSDPHSFMARILQYCECPQYLRRHFFPMHPDLQFAGMLHPIDAPHHVRAQDHCRFREGVVLEKVQDGKSLVNCGIHAQPVLIEQRLQPGIRCTVELDPAEYGRPGQMRGKVVSPSTATQTDGTYWGYTVRMANSIKAVFDECPYGTYDLTIGTSERGSESVDEPGFSLLSSSKRTSRDYRHALIVFGGVAGIEECVDADESLKISGSTSYTMFDKWINVCPYQGSRTIRSEEAILVTLAKLSPLLVRAACTSKEGNTERLDSVDDLSPLHQNKKSQVEKSAGQALTIKFDDNDVSEESSESEMDDE